MSTAKTIPTVQEWLEDSPSGRYARFSTVGEQSLWLCMRCTQAFEDCQCEDAEEMANEDPCFI